VFIAFSILNVNAVALWRIFLCIWWLGRQDNIAYWRS